MTFGESSHSFACFPEGRTKKAEGEILKVYFLSVTSVLCCFVIVRKVGTT